MTDTETTGGVCATIEEESEPKTSDPKSEPPAKESSSSENDSSVFKKIETDSIAPIAQSTPKSPLFMDDVLGGLSKVEREVMPTPREEKSPVESESNGTDTTSVATTVLPVEEPMVSVDIDSEPEQDSISEQISKNETTIDKLDSQDCELPLEQNQDESKDAEPVEAENCPTENQSEVAGEKHFDDVEEQLAEDVTAEANKEPVENSVVEEASEIIDNEVKPSDEAIDQQTTPSDESAEKVLDHEAPAVGDEVSGQLGGETQAENVEVESTATIVEPAEAVDETKATDEDVQLETEAEIPTAAESSEVADETSLGNKDVSEIADGEGLNEDPEVATDTLPTEDKTLSENHTETEENQVNDDSQPDEEQEEDISVRTQSTDDVHFSSTLEQKLDDASESKDSEYVEAREEIDESPIQLVADVILNADPVAIADAVTDSVIEEIVEMKLEVESSPVVETEVKVDEKPVETLVDTSTDDLVEHSREINDVITGLYEKFDHLIPAYF